MSDALENQRIEIERLRDNERDMVAAMEELLSGHDNLYRSHFHYLPTCNPEDDIAAKAVRSILAVRRMR